MRPRRALGGEGRELDSLDEVLAQVEERRGEPLRRLAAHAVVGAGFGHGLPGQLRRQRLIAGEAVGPRERRQGFRAGAPGRRRGPSLLEQLDRPSRVAGIEAVEAGADRPAMEVGERVRRRQAASLLAELRRGGARSPGAGVFGGALEGGRDVRVRPVDGERKVARSFLLVVDDTGEAAVKLAPGAGVDVVVRGGGEERVHEAEGAVVDPEDLGGDRRLQRVRLVPSLLEEGERRLREGRRGRERAARRRGQRVEPFVQELAKSLRHGERLPGNGCRPASLERTTELERVEGVAGRDLVQAAQRRPRQDEAYMLLQEAVDGPGAQRGDVEPAGPVVFGQREGHRLAGPARSEEAGGLVAQSPPGEGEHGCGRRVEPLQVVHGDERRPLRGELPERVQEGKRDCTLVGRRTGRSFEQERHPERVGLGHRERVEEVVQSRLEQVAQARERESRLRLGGACLEDPAAALPRRVRARAPEGRLADAGLADEDERGRAGGERGHEFAEQGKFFVTSDNAYGSRCRHLPATILRARTAAGKCRRRRGDLDAGG